MVSIQKSVEIRGVASDVEGLSKRVASVFGVTVPIDMINGTEERRVIFVNTSGEPIARAFGRGLAMYLRGFVDSKVDGSLRLIEEEALRP